MKESVNSWLTILQCPQLGIATLHRLKPALDSITDLTVLPTSRLKELGLKAAQIQHFKKHSQHPRQQQHQQYANQQNQNEVIADYLSNNNITLISIEDRRYPALLKETVRPPIVLFAQGDLSLLNAPQMAFVGSRVPTQYGIDATKVIVRDMVSAGYVITSGLALGIDCAAHEQALTSGGKTIAVMGGGHANIYPKRHLNLARQIVENGVLLSEFLPFQIPQQFNFPRRNRVIAGLCKGTIVVEGAQKSGSLITAKYALESNRDVYAVPGSIFNPIAQGTHQLIQQGAKLVTSGADILIEYGQVIEKSKGIVKNHLAGSKMLASVDHDTTSVDVISQRSNLPVEQVLMELLDLEIQGQVIAVPGGYSRVVTHSNNN